MSAGHTVGVLGRDEELELITSVLEQATQSGQAAAIVVMGEAGIGKSCVASAAATIAAGRDITILQGEANDLGHVGAVEAPGHPSTDPRALASQSIVARIEATAVKGPVLLVVEDLHWADDATAAALHALMRRLADLPFALLATTRPAPAAPRVDALVDDLRRGGATMIELTGLDPTASVAVAEATLGAKCGKTLANAVAAAAGNPLLITEFVSELRAAERLVERDGVAEMVEGETPIGLRNGVRRRLSHLSREAVEALEVAAVLGTTFAPTELAVVMGRPIVALLGDLRDALRSGILDEAGEHLRFRHDLVREAIYDDLTPALRSALHLEVARSLANLSGRPSDLVPHLLNGVTRSEPAAIELLERTAEALRDIAPDQALSLYQRQFDLIPETDAAARDRVTNSMLTPLTLTGRATEAETLARQILGRPHHPSLEPALVQELVYALDRIGRSSEMRMELESLVQSVPLDDSLRLFVDSYLAEALFGTGQVDEAETLARDVVERANAAQDDDLAACSLATLAWTALARGHVPAALERSAESVRRHPMTSRYKVDVHRMLCLLEADEIEGALELARFARQRDSARGDQSSIVYYHFALLGCDFVRGRWDTAEAEGDAGVQLVAEGAGSRTVEVFGKSLLARLALHRGDTARARALVSDCEQVMAESGPQFGIEVVMWTSALLHEHDANIETAQQLLALAWDLTGPIRYFASWRSIGPDLVRLSMATGDVDRAKSVAADVALGAERAGGVASATAAAMRCQALIDGDHRRLVEAAEVLESSPRIVERACTLRDATEVAADKRARSAAVEAGKAAMALLEELGAGYDQRQVRAAVRRAGGSLPRSTQRSRPTTGWDSLTPSERAVVDLVSRGLTNPEVADRLFISRYTVESHLKKVFAKLGIKSRLDLMRLGGNRP